MWSASQPDLAISGHYGYSRLPTLHEGDWDNSVPQLHNRFQDSKVPQYGDQLDFDQQPYNLGYRPDKISASHSQQCYGTSAYTAARHADTLPPRFVSHEWRARSMIDLRRHVGELLPHDRKQKVKRKVCQLCQVPLSWSGPHC